MKTLSLKRAILVAEEDYNVGIESAIDLLDTFGFDTSYYYNKMNSLTEKEIDEHFDDINIKTRDKLYKKLGITKIMNKAYEIVWE